MDSEYSIKLDVGKLLYYSEVLKPRISNETLLMLIRSFSVYVRDLYKVMIAESIYSNRYKGDWEPIKDEGYLEFLGTTPSEHILDLIYDALEIREIKNNIVIRFEPEYKYPGSKLTLVRVLKAIDNGTSKFNARPILKDAVSHLNRNISGLWRVYLRQKGVT